MRDVDAVDQEMKAAGAWVFAGGLHQPEHRDRGAARGRRRAHHRRPVRRGQGAPGRLHRSSRRPTSTRRSSGAGSWPGRRRCRSRCARSRGSRRRRCRSLAAAEIERVFREQYGRAVAVLVRVVRRHRRRRGGGPGRVRRRACERWPADGVPPSPAGWIITTARNRAIDRLRREASRDDRHAQAALLHARRRRPTEEQAPCATTGCG